MKRMTLYSYGTTLHNRDLPEDSGEATKLQTIATYKFTLACENSICSDYVTEKFFQPLVVGSVPVYLGAPNVAEFAPGQSCYIDANDYATPADLADYLIFLATDERAYGQYLAWKSEPLRPEFMDKVGRVASPSFSRLAGLLRSR